MGMIAGLFRLIGFLIALPFRLVFKTIALLGRIAALIVGFALLVVGVALLAGPWFVLGAFVLLIGLVMVLRSL